MEERWWREIGGSGVHFPVHTGETPTRSTDEQSEICFTDSALGMSPFWVQLWSFHSSRFYCLTCGGLKKKDEGRRDMKGEKEGVEQERRKERKKVLKERKINK